MARTIAMYGPRLDRYSGVSGLVGSHGRSQGAFLTRISRHMRASLTRTGRRLTGCSSGGALVKVTGQARSRPTIPLFSSIAADATLSQASVTHRNPVWHG